jgi:hypothetical protein
MIHQTLASKGDYSILILPAADVAFDPAPREFHSSNVGGTSCAKYEVGVSRPPDVY